MNLKPTTQFALAVKLAVIISVISNITLYVFFKFFIQILSNKILFYLFLPSIIYLLVIYVAFPLVFYKTDSFIKSYWNAFLQNFLSTILFCYFLDSLVFQFDQSLSINYTIELTKITHMQPRLFYEFSHLPYLMQNAVVNSVTIGVSFILVVLLKIRRQKQIQLLN